MNYIKNIPFKKLNVPTYNSADILFKYKGQPTLLIYKEKTIYYDYNIFDYNHKQFMVHKLNNYFKDINI